MAQKSVMNFWSTHGFADPELFFIPWGCGCCSTMLLIKVSIETVSSTALTFQSCCSGNESVRPPNPEILDPVGAFTIYRFQLYSTAVWIKSSTLLDPHSNPMLNAQRLLRDPCSGRDLAFQLWRGRKNGLTRLVFFVHVEWLTHADFSIFQPCIADSSCLWVIQP